MFGLINRIKKTFTRSRGDRATSAPNGSFRVINVPGGAALATQIQQGNSSTRHHHSSFSGPGSQRQQHTNNGPFQAAQAAAQAGASTRGQPTPGQPAANAAQAQQQVCRAAAVGLADSA